MDTILNPSIYVCSVKISNMDNFPIPFLFYIKVTYRQLNFAKDWKIV